MAVNTRSTRCLSCFTAASPVAASSPPGACASSTSAVCRFRGAAVLDTARTFSAGGRSRRARAAPAVWRRRRRGRSASTIGTAIVCQRKRNDKEGKGNYADADDAADSEGNGQEEDIFSGNLLDMFSTKGGSGSDSGSSGSGSNGKRDKSGSSQTSTNDGNLGLDVSLRELQQALGTATPDLTDAAAGGGGAGAKGVNDPASDVEWQKRERQELEHERRTGELQRQRQMPTLARFFFELFEETKLIEWPSTGRIFQLFVSVILSIIVTAALVYTADGVFGWLARLLFEVK